MKYLLDTLILCKLMLRTNVTIFRSGQTDVLTKTKALTSVWAAFPFLDGSITSAMFASMAAGNNDLILEIKLNILGYFDPVGIHFCNKNE